jgi:hypothetical protein
VAWGWRERPIHASDEATILSNPPGPVITDFIQALQPAAIRVGAMILLAVAAIWIVGSWRR